MNQLTDARLRFGPFTYHPQQRLMTAAGRVLPLGGRALDILQVLIERAGQVVDKHTLLARVWPGLVVEESNLRVHIAALRRAFANAGGERDYILNVPQRGYCFQADLQPSAPPSAAPLPVRLTPLIGRAGELQRLQMLLRRHRLCTVSGAPGMGKSSLALAAAEALQARWPGGVRYLDLAEADERPALAEHLAASARQLLLLDNADRCLDACRRLLPALFASQPELRVLLTSREPLGLADEVLLPLDGLAVPLADAPLPASPAVELFLHLARARVPDLLLDERHRLAAAQICRRLDGVPLALELAAAQVDSLGVLGVCARLDSGLPLLTPGRRTAVPRHRSLQAALDWSLQRLSSLEQRVLRQLATFDTAFSAEAAAVLSDEPQLQAVLAGLARRSLLVEEPLRRTPRYRLLQVLRAHLRTPAEGDLQPPRLGAIPPGSVAPPADRASPSPR